MKRVRYLLFAVVLIITFTFSSCHSIYDFQVTAVNGVLDDYFLDILIPVNKINEHYNDKGVCLAYATGNEDNIEKVKKMDIYNYNENGYVSMLSHYQLDGYGIYPQDKQNYNVEFTFNWYKEFKELSKECKKFKFAVIDKEGHILKISDEYSMLAKHRTYIQSVKYDILANKAEIEYEESIFKLKNVPWLIILFLFIGLIF